MLLHNDVYEWKGWGGKLRLGSGRCRLRIFDLRKGQGRKVSMLKPIVVVLTDIPGHEMTDLSVRSCAGHIATSLIRDFAIDPQRALFVQYRPATTYGEKGEHVIAERYEVIEFTWHADKAIKPTWKPLDPHVQETVQQLLRDA